MKTTLPHKLGKTVLVLGAGATRSCSLVDKQHRPLPPLDFDYFTQVQRIKNDKYQHYVAGLLSFCHKHYGPNWTLRMEEFFNQLSYLQYFVPTRETTAVPATKFPGPRGKLVHVPEKRKPVELVFRQLLLGLFEESLFGAHSQDCLQKTCTIHDQVAQALEPDDAIVTFNYDCVADASLVKSCSHWDPSVSYGFRPVPDKAVAYWRGKSKPSAADPHVLLLKLHGSINWQWKPDKSTWKLSMRPYTRQHGDRQFDIVPPALAKEKHLDRFKGLWQKARQSIRECQTLAIIGYSMPPVDALAEALFRSRTLGDTESQVKPLKFLVIANPDRTTRRRLMQVMRKSIGRETRVLVFDDFEQAVNQLVPDK